MIIDIELSDIEENPFPHFLIRSGVKEEDQDSIIEWFEKYAPWNLIESSFYEQYEFSLLQQDFGYPIADFCSDETISYIKNKLSSVFNLSFKDKFEVTAHKLIKGQTIRIHNDFIPGEETHRVLIQFNRGWREEYGGNLMIFAGPNPEDLVKIISPSSGSIQGFAISKKSHHAVSTVHGGERFTIVYSFFANEL